MAGLPKDLRQLERLAREQGWTIKPTSRGHQQWLSPNGAICTAHADHGSPCPRAVLNFRSILKRAGLREKSYE